MAEICAVCFLTHSADMRTRIAPESIAKIEASGVDGALQACICLAATQTAMRRLLELVAGASVKCRGCEALVYWVTHKNGKRTPYTAAGLNHFIDCPAAAQFGKGRT